MFSDKITKAIAEAAKTVMDTTNETWPDAASTSIYADKSGTTPISDAESGNDTQTDESVCPTCDGSGEGHDEGSTCHDCGGSGDSENKYGKKSAYPEGEYDDSDNSGMEESVEMTTEEINEVLKKSQPASEWIADFVNSNNAKFKGKSKGERINMALGAYYAAQRNESVSEGVEEPRSQGEKNFKAAHTIVKMTDPNAAKQSGTEAMDQKAKPALPLGKGAPKLDLNGKKYNDKDVTAIKSSAKRAVAPKGNGPAKLTYADGDEVFTKTVAAIKKSAQGSASAPKATGSKQSGAQSAEKVSNSAPNGKLSAEYPKAKQKGSEAMPKSLKETALATLLGEDAIEEGLFDNIKALGSNVAGAVKSKVAAVGQNVAGAVKSKVAAVGQKIGDEIDKATKQGNAAELARLQARANQLKTNLPADHADAPAGASVPQYKSDPKAFVAQTTKNLADKNTTSDEELLSMLKNCLGNPTQGAAPLLLPIIQAEIKKRRVADMTKDLADKNITSDEKLFSTLKNWQGNPLMLPIIQAEIKKRGLKAGTPVTGAASAAAKPVSGAAAVAQKAALAKLTKMSTSQLQASLARIQGLLKQRGVMEEVSFDEAFELLGEEAINEAMTNFDKQFADDNEKALKSILTGQGTDDIECHGQPKQKVLVQLNKFIASYGDELKKYFSLPIEETEVNA